MSTASRRQDAEARNPVVRAETACRPLAGSYVGATTGLSDRTRPLRVDPWATIRQTFERSA